MAPTPDRRAGRLEEEEILFDDRTGEADPEDERSMRYADGEFRMVDALGTFNPRSTASTSLGLVIITSEGGLVYDTDGDLVIKVAD